MQYAISFYSVIILVLLTPVKPPVETYMPIIMISSQNKNIPENGEFC